MATNSHSVAIQIAAGANTVNQPMLQILGTAYNRPRIMEIGAVYVPSLNSTQTFGIGRPNAEGTPSIYNPNIPVFAENPNDAASTIKLITSWATMPTIPPAYLRRITVRSLAAAVSTVIITFDNGIVINASKSLTVFNILGSTGPPADVFSFWVVIDQ